MRFPKTIWLNVAVIDVGLSNRFPPGKRQFASCAFAFSVVVKFCVLEGQQYGLRNVSRRRGVPGASVPSRC